MTVVVAIGVLVHAVVFAWSSWTMRESGMRAMYDLGVQHGREQVRFERWKEDLHRRGLV